MPDHRESILTALEEDGVVRKNNAGSWDITNLGAVLFAKRLADFGPLGRKAVRVVVYDGHGRLVTLKEHLEPKGYAAGFETLLAFIHGLVPSNEVIGQALRKSVPMYPPLAVRELVANALIHQDFFITGAGPMVEIFGGRIEVTNPGEPLVATDRFVDAPPRSRNEALASLMRRMGICEERGSGVDKIIAQTELYQLPAPLFEVPDGSTRTVLFAHRPLAEMDRSERMQRLLPARLPALRAAPTDDKRVTPRAFRHPGQERSQRLPTHPRRPESGPRGPRGRRRRQERAPVRALVGAGRWGP
jgi:ATP-dependent DNA helicase RecG